MLDIEPRKILVCVSPGEDVDASLRFAVAEAHERGCGIHLALAVRPVWVGPTDVTDLRVVDGEWRKFGTDFILQCERDVQRIAGDSIPVSTEITHGPVVPTLVEISEHAALVVMQHHRMDHAHHIPTLSVTNGVAARAHAPVVAVPDSWREDPETPDVVVVGVEDGVTSSAVAEAAFEEARRIGGSVRLVRAWFFSPAFDAYALSDRSELLQSLAVRQEVEREFAELIARFPDVACEAVGRHGQPADVLVDESHRATRVVVGRHEPSLPLGSHLGPVTRAVLNHASCPVMVIDPRRPQDRPPRPRVATPATATS